MVLNLGELPIGTKEYTFNLDTTFSGLDSDYESSEPEIPEEVEPVASSSSGEWVKVVIGVVGVLLVLVSAGAALMTAQWLINPEG